MNANLHQTPGPRSRGVMAMAGVLVVGLSACSPSDGARSEAGAPSAPLRDSSTSAPATSPSSPPSPSGTPVPADDAVITITNFEYQVPDSVPAGTTVMVVNEDSQAHTVTAQGVFDVNVAPGATGEFTAPDEAGNYDFICTFHGSMRATLVVT